MCVVPSEARTAETPLADPDAKIIDAFVVMPLAHTSPVSLTHQYLRKAVTVSWGFSQRLHEGGCDTALLLGP